MPAPSIPVPGTCYKFVVGAADEAATLIRERLGPEARVLSVRSVPATGLSRIWAAPRLEVIARIDPPALPPAAAPAPAPVREPVVAAAPARRYPLSQPKSLITLLRRSGLSELALGRLQAAPNWEDLQAAPLHRALVEAGRHLRREAE